MLALYELRITTCRNDHALKTIQQKYAVAFSKPSPPLFSDPHTPYPAMPLLIHLLLAFLSFTTLVSSACKHLHHPSRHKDSHPANRNTKANPTSFCKCICGANNTIIPLDAPSFSSSSSSSLLKRRSFPEPQTQPQHQLHTLQPRDDDDEEKNTGAKEKEEKKKKANRKKSCNDCNKQYCINQKLHICEGVKAEEVFATCFRNRPLPFPSLPLRSVQHIS